MRTAKEMYQYCVQNNFDQRWDEQTALSHLKIIEQNLQPDEKVLMCFVGKREIMNGKCAFAITNKHISWGQQNLTSQWHKEILFDTITTITFSGGLFSSMITFGAIGDTYAALNPLDVNSHQSGVTCSVKNITARQIYNKCKSTFEEAKSKLSQTNKETFASSNADEILKYKQLLDMGVITQEEFDKKKKQLLE